MRSSKNQKSQSTLTGNEVSENIKEIMEEVLNVGLKEIKTRLLNIQSVNAAINERLTALENRLGGVRERLEVLEAKDDDVEKRLSFLEKRLDTERENPILHGENQLKERILSLELKLRSKNLIFGGVREIRVATTVCLISKQSLEKNLKWNVYRRWRVATELVSHRETKKG